MGLQKIGVVLLQGCRKLAAVEKHPLALLLLGTAIGSVAIPHFNARAARDARLADLRVEHAKSALATANDVDKRLNAILTTFANYLKDEVGDGNDVQAAPEAVIRLRERVYDQYGEFDATAWWWHWRYLRDASLLHLVDDNGATEIRHACETYQQTLIDTVNELGRLWRPLMKKGRIRTHSISHEEVRARIAALRNERVPAVERMVAPLLR